MACVLIVDDITHFGFSKIESNGSDSLANIRKTTQEKIEFRNLAAIKSWMTVKARKLPDMMMNFYNCEDSKYCFEYSRVYFQMQLTQTLQLDIFIPVVDLLLLQYVTSKSAKSPCSSNITI